MRALLALLALTLPALAQEKPVSGYDFLLPETQALQDDPFANPGRLWVEMGDNLWQAGDPSCADCHGAAKDSMTGVGARYPVWSESEGWVITLERRINLCRQDKQGLEPIPHEDDRLLALSAFVMHQSRGLPISVDVEGPAADAFARGQAYYFTPRGQLDLSCADCHVSNVGNRLRGEVISQGQVNGFPIYRQLWQDIGSVGRIIAWCNEAVRARPLSPDSQEAAELELYLRGRGNGLIIETPAVRR